jgi:hypothetical protein
MEEKNEKTGHEVIRVRVQPQIHEPAHAICPARPRYALFYLIPPKTLQIRSNWRDVERIRAILRFFCGKSVSFLVFR